MDTSWLQRRLVSVCGNYLIKVDKNFSYISTGLSESSLSDVQYKNRKISFDSNFGKDVGKIFSNAQSNLFFVGDDFESEVGYVNTTLLANGEIPSMFVIMKTNGSTDKKDHTIHDYYDLSEKSTLGGYLRRHFLEPKFVDRPVFVDFENKHVTINGIDLTSGSVTSKVVSLDTISDDQVSDLFRVNNMIPSNILHISFNIGDIDLTSGDYYCMFADEINLGSFYPKNLKKPFVPLIYNGRVSGNFEIEEFSGISINPATDVPYHFSKSSNKIVSSSNIVDGAITIDDFLLVNFEISKEADLKRSENTVKSISFKPSTLFTQSQTIRFIFKSMDFELVADALFNNPDFGIEDAERFVFNPTGDIHQQCRSMCKAFANMVEDKSYHSLDYDGEYLVLSSELGYLDLEIVSILSDVQLIYLGENVTYPLFSDNNLLECNTGLEIGNYIKSNVGYHLVSGYLPYNKDGKIDRWVTENEYRGVFDQDRVWNLEKIGFGILNPYNLSDLETIIKENKTIVEPFIKKYLAQTTLTVGEEYQVKYGSVEHNSVVYNVGDSFIALNENVLFITTGSEVHIKKYLLDQEVQSFLQSHLGDITTSTSTSVVLSWVVLGTKDSKQEDYELQFSQTQNFFEHDYEPSLNTHSFYLLSNEMGGIFDEYQFSLTSKDYFVEYFGNKNSIVSKDKFGYQTVFNGARVRFSKEDLEDHLFSCILNIRDISEANQDNKKLFDARVLYNEDNKKIVMVLDLYVSDYKATDGTNITVDYGYLAMMSGIYKNGGYGDTFSLPAITGIVYTDPTSTILTDEFRGLKINHNINQQANPPMTAIEFEGGFVKVDTTVREVNGDVGGIIGVHRTNMSLVSNLPNLYQGTGFFGLDTSASGLNPVSVVGNTINFETGSVYVTSLNGTIFDTYIPVQLLKSIENFKDYEWYQVQDIKSAYDRIRKLMSLAGIYDIFNMFADSITSEVGEIKLEKPSENGFYDAYFTVNTIEQNTFLGSTVLSNWCTEQNPWTTYFMSWNNAPLEANLGSLLGTEININIS